jgi:hypothetical protein
MTGRGAGGLDLIGLSGEGIAILSLGNAVACYMEDGVAILSRTFVSTAPFTVSYIDNRRGLLGTKAVTDVGSGVHFGIFDDGWFFLDSQGQWTEAGLLPLGGQNVRPWQDDFYSTLNRERAFTISVSYDPFSHIVRIAWPSLSSEDGFPDKVWNYDITTNTVWPDDYAIGGGNALCWAYAKTVTESGQTWSGIGGNWSDQDGVQWSDLAAEQGPYRIIHGTRLGFVMEHDPLLLSRNNNQPSWVYKTLPVSLTAVTSLKTVDKVWVEFEAVLGGSPIALQVSDGKTTSTGSSVTTNSTTLEVDPGFVLSDFAGFRVSANHHIYSFSGGGAIRLHGGAVQTLSDDSEKLGVEPT